MSQKASPGSELTEIKIAVAVLVIVSSATSFAQISTTTISPFLDHRNDLETIRNNPIQCDVQADGNRDIALLNCTFPVDIFLNNLGFYVEAHGFEKAATEISQGVIACLWEGKSTTKPTLVCFGQDGHKQVMDSISHNVIVQIPIASARLFKYSCHLGLTTSRSRPCQLLPTATPVDSGGNGGLMAGVSVACLIGIILIAVPVTIIIKKRSKRKQEKQRIRELTTTSLLTTQAEREFREEVKKQPLLTTDVGGENILIKSKNIYEGLQFSSEPTVQESEERHRYELLKLKDRNIHKMRDELAERKKKLLATIKAFDDEMRQHQEVLDRVDQIINNPTTSTTSAAAVAVKAYVTTPVPRTGVSSQQVVQEEDETRRHEQKDPNGKQMMGELAELDQEQLKAIDDEMRKHQEMLERVEKIINENRTKLKTLNTPVYRSFSNPTASTTSAAAIAVQSYVTPVPRTGVSNVVVENINRPDTERRLLSPNQRDGAFLFRTTMHLKTLALAVRWSSTRVTYNKIFMQENGKCEIEYGGKTCSFSSLANLKTYFTTSDGLFDMDRFKCVPGLGVVTLPLTAS